MRLPCGISTDEFFDNLRAIMSEELKQDQLLTREGVLKSAGIGNVTNNS